MGFWAEGLRGVIPFTPQPVKPYAKGPRTRGPFRLDSALGAGSVQLGQRITVQLQLGGLDQFVQLGH